MEPILCVPKVLPLDRWVPAANTSVKINPANLPDLRTPAYMPRFHLEPMHIAALTKTYWGAKGVRLGVRFLDNLSAAFKAALLRHMNRWADYANVSFAETLSSGPIRVATEPGKGHYSYLGTDCLHIPSNQPTMNFDGFSENTSEEELARVVEHESGHALGFVHEHMRRDIISRIDLNKAVAYFARTQDWSRTTTIAQVLTPVEERALLMPQTTDEDSVMAYQLPGDIMLDGKPVVGGKGITAADGKYAGLIYPKPHPSGDGPRIVVSEQLLAGTYRLVQDTSPSLN